MPRRHAIFVAVAAVFASPSQVLAQQEDTYRAVLSTSLVVTLAKILPGPQDSSYLTVEARNVLLKQARPLTDDILLSIADRQGECEN